MREKFLNMTPTNIKYDAENAKYWAEKNILQKYVKYGA